MSDTKTRAELVAALMGNDRRNYRAPDGRSLGQVCLEWGARIPFSGPGEGDFVFDDGSSITVVDGEFWLVVEKTVIPR